MRYVILVLSAVLLLSYGSVDADCIDYGDYLHWESVVPFLAWSMDVDVSGNYACVALQSQSGGGGLSVVDIADPASPQIVGALESGAAIALSIAGTLACVIGGPGFQIVDLADPRSPVLRGSLDFQGHLWGVSVAVSGTHAYVGTEGSLLVVDIADPDHPRRLGEVWTEYAYKVAVSGTFVYIANCMYGLKVVDVTDPENPRIVASLALPGYAETVVVGGAYAYVAGEGFFVVDISDPQNPRLVGSAAGVDEVRGVAVSGTHVLLATSCFGLQSVDVADPEHPRIVGSTSPGGAGSCAKVALSGGHACVVAGSALHLVAIGNAEGAPSVSHMEMHWPAELAIQGTHAYAAVDLDGFAVIDIEDPENPHLVGGLDTSTRIRCVAVADNLVYAGGTDSGALLVIDVQDPASPVIVGSVPTAGIRDVAISGSHAYAAASEAGLVVIDIADPEHPFVAGSVATPDWAFAIAITGSEACILDEVGGFLVADVSDPASPRIVGHLPAMSFGVGTPDWPSNLAASGTFAYVGAIHGSLQIVDVGDPQNPRMVGGLELMGGIRGVAISGTTVYLADEDGLRVVHASDPTNPRVLGDAFTPGEGTCVAVAGSHAYLGTYNPGEFHILDLQCEEPSSVAAHRGPPRGLRVSPSPANARATVQLALPATGWVLATIRDVNGRRLRRLHEGTLSSGPHEFVWDGRDDAGRKVRAGIYLVQVSTDQGTATSRFVIMR
jgi:hypothetical protein